MSEITFYNGASFPETVNGDLTFGELMGYTWGISLEMSLMEWHNYEVVKKITPLLAGDTEIINTPLSKVSDVTWFNNYANRVWMKELERKERIFKMSEQTINLSKIYEAEEEVNRDFMYEIIHQAEIPDRGGWRHCPIIRKKVYSEYDMGKFENSTDSSFFDYVRSEEDKIAQMFANKFNTEVRWEIKTFGQGHYKRPKID